MSGRSWKWRVAAWLMLTLCLLLGGVQAASLRYKVTWIGRGKWVLYVEHGYVLLMHAGVRAGEGMRINVRPLFKLRRTRWQAPDLRPRGQWGPSGMRLTIAPVLLLVPLGPLTAVLWWPEARRVLSRAMRKPWECRGCRYDLRGCPNSAVCPECGRKIKK